MEKQNLEKRLMCPNAYIGYNNKIKMLSFGCFHSNKQ